MLRLLRPLIRMKLLFVRNCEEKKFCVSFAVAPPAAKITVMVHGKSLVKMEKAFGKSLQLGTSLVVRWLRLQ